MRAEGTRAKGVANSGGRILGLGTGETRPVSPGLHTIASTMTTRRCTAKRLRETSQKSQEKYKAFSDICKYFSEEEWAKLGHSQKITYVYMKRNYETMTRLGLNTTLPSFMRPRNQTTKSPESESDEDQNPRNQDEGPHEASNVQQREHAKEMPMKAAREENDTKPLPVTPGSEPAQKELCPLGKANASGQESERMSGHSKVKCSVWADRLRERKIRVVYEEISDPMEDD
ncbi:putative protein SSX6 [Hipposideros larvatus]